MAEQQSQQQQNQQQQSVEQVKREWENGEQYMGIMRPKRLFVPRKW